MTYNILPEENNDLESNKVSKLRNTSICEKIFVVILYLIILKMYLLLYITIYNERKRHN